MNDSNTTFAEALTVWPDVAIKRLFEWVGNGQELGDPDGGWTTLGVP